jgi:hypothetical protein
MCQLGEQDENGVIRLNIDFLICIKTSLPAQYDTTQYPMTRVKIAPVQGLFASTYRE